MENPSNNPLNVKFQRELNRVFDSDRTTRKRGLQKLLEDLPWEEKTEKEYLDDFLVNSLFKALLTTISDSVEKCRELTLQLVKKVLEICCLSDENQLALVQVACNRIADVPYAEPSEELRLHVAEIIFTIVKKKCGASGREATAAAVAAAATEGAGSVSGIVDGTILIDCVLKTLTKSLLDSFPNVKRTGAQILSSACKAYHSIARIYFKPLLKALIPNASHQHAKTRCRTVHAICALLKCVPSAEYESAMKDPILNLFLKLQADRSASVKTALGTACGDLLSFRIQMCMRTSKSLIASDYDVLSVLLLINGDDTEDVGSHGSACLQSAVSYWAQDVIRVISTKADDLVGNSSIEDGEMELSNAAAAAAATYEEAATVDTGPMDGVAAPSGTAVAVVTQEAVAASHPQVISQEHVSAFIKANLCNIIGVMVAGAESWSTDNRTRYLAGLAKMIVYAQEAVSDFLPVLFGCLGGLVRDEDTMARTLAESCCVLLGSQVDPSEALDIILPRVSGAVAGGDTASQRTSAIRVLTHALAGFNFSRFCAKQSPVALSERDFTDTQLLRIAGAIGQPSLYEFREPFAREATLLLNRSFLANYSKQIYADPSDTAVDAGARSRFQVQQHLAVSLTYLCGRCISEHDVVPEAAKTELRNLAVVVLQRDSSASSSANNKLISEFLNLHYDHVLMCVTGGKIPEQLDWDVDSAAKSAFDVLIRECPMGSWARHSVILPIFVYHVQPPKAVEKGSAEDNMRTMLAVRGEEAVPEGGDVNIRLTMLALLEGWIKAGVLDWECGKFISGSAELIFTKIIIPNLTWRVGRVEAVVRKVTLAACYGILRAGSITGETLFKVAPTLVPMIVNHLDDMDTTPREMACHCLSVLFVRLKGAFGDQSIREIYPKLLARLDDSVDGVRVACCGTMEVFLQCAAPNMFSGTTIDYMLDQLFIHLDDPDAGIQQAVLSVIMVASQVNKDLVCKKAQNCRTTHRSPDMCDKVLLDVTGFQVLED